MRTQGLLLAVIVAGWALMTQPGCGGGAKTSAAVKPAATVAQVGAICDTALAPDSTSTAAAVAPADTALRPKPAAPDTQAKVTGKPKALPRMWDFGSTNCIPCKAMKEILDPMIADYKGKVGIRIVIVGEEKELTQQARIQIIPTQIFYSTDGKELFRHVGVYPRDSIEAKFRELGFPVVAGTLPHGDGR